MKLTNGTSSSSSESAVLLLRFGGEFSTLGSFFTTVGVVSFLTTGVVGSLFVVGVVVTGGALLAIVGVVTGSVLTTGVFEGVFFDGVDVDGVFGVVVVVVDA